MTRVIDMRCRPAFLHDFFGATPGSAANDVARWLNGRVGTRGDLEHYARSRTQQGFVDEVRDAGLSHAVVVGRQIPGQVLSNDLIHSIVADTPELLGIAGIDIQTDGQAALDEAERAIRTLGLAGIDIEPGFGSTPLHPDDPLFFPVYELCASLGVPVFLMTGPTSPDLRFNDPAPLARVAQAFPLLPIVCYHGYWPNTQQAVGLAFRYANIHLVPDMYIFQPGSQVYVEAANGFLADQLLFGSSYPFRPIGQSIEDFQQLGFRDAVLDKLLYANAARLFGIA
ncbi:amidohydrolase family protein [Zoogloea sp.]|uniref:amidohydrolase family protein n=1 Tax=Zoogloea sp. TaxID=49181 RepID=UPI0035B2E30E